MDRLLQLEKEVEALKAAVSRLQEEVRELGKKPCTEQLESLLSQRGLPVLAHGDRSQLLLPAGHSTLQVETFYRLMRRYSFRLFLRELLQFPRGDDFNALTRYCSLKTVRSYMKTLAALGIVRIGRDRSYRLAPRHIISFGATLEWYVSEVFRREFRAPVLFGVRLHNTQHGGDFDVISLLSGYLVYVEVKSSPPRGVELQAVSAFLKRLQDLQPQMAVFLVDTELRMADKMVPLFAEALEQMGRGSEEWPVVRLYHEIFHIRHTIYIMNSRKGIYTNLRYGFRDFLRCQQ